MYGVPIFPFRISNYAGVYFPCTWEWDGSFMLTACRRPAGIIKYREYFCSRHDVRSYVLPRYRVDWHPDYNIHMYIRRISKSVICFNLG